MQTSYFIEVLPRFLSEKVEYTPHSTSPLITTEAVRCPVRKHFLTASKKLDPERIFPTR